MAGSLLPQPKQTFQDNTGNPLAGGKIYTYAAGTLTPKDTYQDAGLTVANTNPVIANSRGEVVMYGSGQYRVILKDAQDNTIWDRDNIGGIDLSAADGAKYVGKIASGGTLAEPMRSSSSWAIINDLKNNIDGGVPGLRVDISPSQVANPVAGDSVALFARMENTGRPRNWAFNTVSDITAGQASTTWGIEVDITNNYAAAPDAHGIGHAIGIDVVSGGLYSPSVAYTMGSSTLANRWKHGMQFEDVGGQAGSTLIRVAGAKIDVDYGIDMKVGTYNKMALRIGATAEGLVAGVGIQQLGNGKTAIHLQRFTDTEPTGNILQLTDAVNSTVLAKLDVLGNLTATSLSTTNSSAAGYFIATAACPTLPAGQVGFGVTTVTAAAAGSASALPATPAGYLVASVGGAQVKLPYYA